MLEAETDAPLKCYWSRIAFVSNLQNIALNCLALYKITTEAAVTSRVWEVAMRKTLLPLATLAFLFLFAPTAYAQGSPCSNGEK